MSHKSEKVYFRQYTEKDLAACSRFAADAWPAISRIVSQKDVDTFMNAYVKLGYCPSTWREVACISGEVVGFLFGRIDKDVSTGKRLYILFSSLNLFLKILLGRYGKIERPFTVLEKFLATESKVKECIPRVDGAIEFFVVDSKYRGMGIGRTLVDRFLCTAKEKDVKTISVYTDQLSNWKFYEIYGFQRICSFHDDLNSYIVQKDVEGYIYVYRIQD